MIGVGIMVAVSLDFELSKYSFSSRTDSCLITISSNGLDTDAPSIRTLSLGDFRCPSKSFLPLYSHAELSSFPRRLAGSSSMAKRSQLEAFSLACI
jgi:hypothetical protein